MNVIAMLIAFTAAVALANYLLSLAFAQIGWQTEKPLQMIFGYVNWPFAFLMGIPAEDCLVVGQAMGERIVLNEFVGYFTLAGSAETLQPRSFAIAT